MSNGSKAPSVAYSLASEILATFTGFDLPEEITERFDVLELLSQNELGETYLLSEKDSGRWYVLKSFRHGTTCLESDILKGLNHKGLPSFEPEVLWGETLFTLREYIEGITLEEYLDQHHILDDAQAIGIMLELCEIIDHLHSQPIPIIHRDIKPSNIIINPQCGALTLIDFGIARRYNQHSSKDTTVFATIEFAPPEQFGFAQTDARTDIYSLGVVLRYMLTGMTGHNTPINNKVMYYIIQKCTALDPKERFQSIASLQKALEKCKPRPPRKVLKILLAALLIVLVFLGGYMFATQRSGAPTPWSGVPIPYPLGEAGPPQPLAPMGANTETYEFVEPLVEAVVRKILGIDDYEPITYGALEAIREIYIHGVYPVLTYPSYGWYGYGDIYSLEDFRIMPNLRYLHIGMQPVSDISSLADNVNLAGVNFTFTNVEDISSIAALPHMLDLRFFYTQVGDWSVVETMRGLTGLWVRGPEINIRSVSDLGDISFLYNLKIAGSYDFVCLEGIQNMPLLISLYIFGTGVRDFSLLNDINALPNLEYLVISRDMQQYLYTLGRNDVVVKLYQ